MSQSHKNGDNAISNPFGRHKFMAVFSNKATIELLVNKLLTRSQEKWDHGPSNPGDMLQKEGGTEFMMWLEQEDLSGIKVWQR
jgi:hypothetical protein